MKHGIVAIVGPTGAGKSAVALALAERFGAEIVSADSRQVYRYLDIGTAKPTAAERSRVAHHLIDVVDPAEPFDVARFRAMALAAIGDILERRKRVIVCGGTGLYVRALTRGLFQGPGANPALRERLARMERDQGRGALWRVLRERDPRAAARLHPNDLARIVRALEVLALTGRTISSWQNEHGFRDSPFDCLMIGLMPARSVLYAGLEERCRAMVSAGLAGEVEDLYRRGYSPDLPALQSLGYRELGRYVRGEAELEAAFRLFVRETRRFAKRQITWFRREPELLWLDPEKEQTVIGDAVGEFLASRC